ncbi:MAG: tetratricopeptide repeat protein [Candidatus Cloacimonetes bacterium]|nr:tetratricopeptide repeat protein [Candidatus Cloacimonadota bacterium]
MKNKFLIIILVLPIICSAYDFFDGGVRNSAMGGTGISSSNDASSAVWNPALLGNLNTYQLLTDSRKITIQLDNDSWSQNVMYFTVPTKKIGTFALSANYFGGDVAGEGKFGFHYGKNLPKNLFIGFSANYYIFDTTIEDIMDYDCDFGIGYKLAFVKLGVVAKNLLQADLGSNSEDKLPRIYGFGSSFNLKNLTISADIQRENNYDSEEILFAVGAEYLLADNLVLRAGVNNYDFTAGLCIKLFSKNWVNPFLENDLVKVRFINVSIDYSVQYQHGFSFGNEDGSTFESDFGNHFVGIKIDFGKITTSKENVDKFLLPSIKADVEVDTIFVEKVRIDTLVKEVTVFDTVKIMEKIADESLVEKRVKEEIEKVKVEEFDNLNEASIHLSNALKYYYAEEYDKAIEECEIAISYAPNFSLSYLRIGSIYYKLGNIDEAIYYWRKGQKVDPNNEELNRILENY